MQQREETWGRKKKCLFVITLHICRISSCGLEGLISHGEFLNLCCVVTQLLSLPTKASAKTTICLQRPEQMKQKRFRGAASEARGGCLLSVGVRKWQASRLVPKTNGRTGVAAGQSADQ